MSAAIRTTPAKNTIQITQNEVTVEIATNDVTDAPVDVYATVFQWFGSASSEEATNTPSSTALSEATTLVDEVSGTYSKLYVIS
jgi:phage major head subunit gpT-like protein